MPHRSTTQVCGLLLQTALRGLSVGLPVCLTVGLSQS